MRQIRNVCLLGTCMVLLAAARGFAEEGMVELRTVAEVQTQVLQPDGSLDTRLVPAAKVLPGDVVAYTIEARNIGATPAERVVITDPIPEQMRFVVGSAEAAGSTVLFSVDGGMRFDAAQKLEVVEADGTRRAATPTDYTHIRFVFDDPLAPSSRRSVRFLAQLQ
jgi:uncharacterized repeat protein (TIGR01451 family)